MKSKFNLWQLRFYNLLNEKKGEEKYDFVIFLKTHRFCQSQEILF